MSEEELILALKQKKLPTFGTKSERVERMRKLYSINTDTNEKKKSTMTKLQEIERNRQERRKKMQKKRETKKNKEIANVLNGRKGDVEFEAMIEDKKFSHHKLSDHINSNLMKVCVCVRKRPIF